MNSPSNNPIPAIQLGATIHVFLFTKIGYVCRPAITLTIPDQKTESVRCNVFMDAEHDGGTICKWIHNDHAVSWPAGFDIQVCLAYTGRVLGRGDDMTKPTQNYKSTALVLMNTIDEQLSSGRYQSQPTEKAKRKYDALIRLLDISKTCSNLDLAKVCRLYVEVMDIAQRHIAGGKDKTCE